MVAGHRGGEEIAGDEVAVGDRIDAVFGQAGEAEALGDVAGVDRIGYAGEGAGAEGKDVGDVVGGVDEGGVAGEHPLPGQQVMGQENRLGHLEVGETGGDDFGIGRGEVENGAAERADGLLEPPGGGAEVKAEVGGDLVIAAAGGVEHAGDCADVGE